MTVVYLPLNAIALEKRSIQQTMNSHRAFHFPWTKGPGDLTARGGCPPRAAAEAAAGKVRSQLSVEPEGGGPSRRQAHHLLDSGQDTSSTVLH